MRLMRARATPELAMRVLLIGVAFGFGCSDDGPVADPYRCVAAGGEACFELPTGVVGGADSSGAAVEPILVCDSFAPATSASAIMFSGHTIDFNAADTYLSEVRIEAAADIAFTSKIFDVTSDTEGVWTATAIVPNVAFARTTAAGQLPIYFMYGRIDINDPVQDMFDVQSATRLQIAASIEVAGDRFLPGTSQVAARAFDCNGNRLVNVIGNIAPASGKNGSRLFEPGVRTYYGMPGPLPVLARRTELGQTTSAGVIGFTNLAPGHHFVQVWGFPDDASLAQGSLGLDLFDEKELIVFDNEAAFLVELNGRL
jgi:hypothetical protein